MNTRKDFQASADLIRRAAWPTSVKAEVAKDFVAKYQTENPRFDEERFYIACGVQVIMNSFENIGRNLNRFRKVSGRKRTSWIDKMTPQGQAIYCAEFVENAAGFNPELEIK